MAIVFWPTWRSRDVPGMTGDSPLDVALQLEDGHVLALFLADQLGLPLLAVGQGDQELDPVLDDVEVGHDVTLVVPDEAGAAAARHLLLLAEEEVADELDVGDEHDRVLAALDDVDGVALVLGQLGNARGGGLARGPDLGGGTILRALRIAPGRRRILKDRG